MAPLRPPMKGELFGYAPGRVAFESPPAVSITYNNKCILLGGLSDGLMPVPYTSALEEACCTASSSVDDSSNCGWSLVQPILSSSYLGFGHGSLDRDVTELDELLSHLVDHREGQFFSMVGHSTGTQDIVHYLQHGRPELVSKIRMVALQAPVSDRESATLCHGCHDKGHHDEHMADLKAHLELARGMLRDKNEDEMMPRKAFWAPITAARYLALFETKGNDDYFSSDLTDEELSARLGHIGALGDTLDSCLVACSGSDEYVPETVSIESLMHRLCNAIDSNLCSDGRKVAVPLYLPTGNHNLSSEDGADAKTFVEKIKELLARCT